LDAMTQGRKYVAQPPSVKQPQSQPPHAHAWWVAIIGLEANNNIAATTPTIPNTRRRLVFIIL